MTHVFEHATSGRAKCRGCDGKIEKGELRFGERQANAFGEGEMTLWFHPRCAAYKRPEPLLEALAEATDALAPGEGQALAEAAETGVAHSRLPELDGAGRSPTGRARCRACRELIAKDDWRLALAFFEEFRRQPAGFIHSGCAADYFGTTAIMERVRHFSPELTADDLEALRDTLQA